MRKCAENDVPCEQLVVDTGEEAAAQHNIMEDSSSSFSFHSCLSTTEMIETRFNVKITEKSDCNHLACVSGSEKDNNNAVASEIKKEDCNILGLPIKSKDQSNGGLFLSINLSLLVNKSVMITGKLNAVVAPPPPIHNNREDFLSEVEHGEQHLLDDFSENRALPAEQTVERDPMVADPFAELIVDRSRSRCRPCGRPCSRF